jgi:xylulokinase
MGERTPHLDPDARGIFFGLSARHTKYDLLQAVMEGVAFSLKDCINIFNGMNLSIEEMLACGGGGSSPLWRQMLANVYGLNVHTTVSKEGPALGVALLAGVGTGLYSNLTEACSNVVKINSTQTPDLEAMNQYNKYYDIYTQLYPSLKKSYKDLASIQ